MILEFPQLDKYKNYDFGRCPRVYCSGQPCIPVGQSDIPRSSTVKIYCPRCEDIYYPRSKYQGSILICYIIELVWIIVDYASTFSRKFFLFICVLCISPLFGFDCEIHMYWSPNCHVCLDVSFYVLVFLVIHLSLSLSFTHIICYVSFSMWNKFSGGS